MQGLEKVAKYTSNGQRCLFRTCLHRKPMENHRTGIQKHILYEHGVASKNYFNHAFLAIFLIRHIVLIPSLYGKLQHEHSAKLLLFRSSEESNHMNLEGHEDE